MKQSSYRERGQPDSRDFTTARLADRASMLRNNIFTTWLDSAQPVPDPNAGKEAQMKEKCSLEGVPMNESATLRDRVIMYVGAFFFLGGWPVSQDANSPQMTRAPDPTFETLDSTYPEFWVTRHTKKLPPNAKNTRRAICIRYFCEFRAPANRRSSLIRTHAGNFSAKSLTDSFLGVA